MFGRRPRSVLMGPAIAMGQQGSAQPDRRNVSPEFDQATNQQIVRQYPNPMNLGMYNKLYQEPQGRAHHMNGPPQGSLGGSVLGQSVAAAQQASAQALPYMQEGPHTTVSPENDYMTNWRIVQKYGGDANYMMFERMYGDDRTAAQEDRLYGPADGLSPFNSYEQNLERARGDSDYALLDYYYNPKRSTDPAPYTSGIIPNDKIGPAEHGYNEAKRLFGYMKK